MHTWRKRLLAHFNRKFGSRNDQEKPDPNREKRVALTRAVNSTLARSSSLERRRTDLRPRRSMAYSGSTASAVCTLDRRLNVNARLPVVLSISPASSPDHVLGASPASVTSSVASAATAMDAGEKQKLEDKRRLLEGQLAQLEQREQELIVIEEQLLQRAADAGIVRRALNSDAQLVDDEADSDSDDDIADEPTAISCTADQFEEAAVLPRKRTVQVSRDDADLDKLRLRVIDRFRANYASRSAP